MRHPLESIRVKVFLLICLLAPFINKSLPIVRKEESYIAFFPKKPFEKKLKEKPIDWMQEQLDRDFHQDFSLSQKALEKTFEKGSPHLCHYRIIDNCLYKRKSRAGKVSGKDTRMEKALKTLLVYAKIPDLEFLYCPMDGIPEPYLSPNFYFSSPQAPIFAQAKRKKAPFIILIPDQFSLSDDWFTTSKEIRASLKEDVWENKEEIAFWRGGFTDMGAPSGTFVANWQDSLRFQICAADSPLIDAKFSWGGSSSLNELFEKQKVLGGAVSKRGHLKYKYLPVLDGHMCTYPGYQWRLLSKSVCFKVESDQIQWFYHALKPFIHYVPIEKDLSDLEEKIVWAKSHDAEIRKMSENATEFVLNHLLIEDDYFYLYLALKRYADVQKIDKISIQKDLKANWECIQYRKRLSLLKSLRKVFHKVGYHERVKDEQNISRVL